jgi:hypothetical protein
MLIFFSSTADISSPTSPIPCSSPLTELHSAHFFPSLLFSLPFSLYHIPRSFMLCHHTKYHSGDQIKKTEMGRACSVGKGEVLTEFWSGNLR